MVTAADILFAVTMCAFVFSGLQVLGQIGTTIGLGLLSDTLIVRSFKTRPSQRFSGTGSGGRNEPASALPAKRIRPTDHVQLFGSCCSGRTTTKCDVWITVIRTLIRGHAGFATRLRRRLHMVPVTSAALWSPP